MCFNSSSHSRSYYLGWSTQHVAYNARPRGIVFPKSFSYKSAPLSQQLSKICNSSRSRCLLYCLKVGCCFRGFLHVYAFTSSLPPPNTFHFGLIRTRHLSSLKYALSTIYVDTSSPRTANEVTKEWSSMTCGHILLMNIATISKFGFWRFHRQFTRPYLQSAFVEVNFQGFCAENNAKDAREQVSMNWFEKIIAWSLIHGYIAACESCVYSSLVSLPSIWKLVSGAWDPDILFPMKTSKGARWFTMLIKPLHWASITLADVWQTWYSLRVREDVR